MKPNITPAKTGKHVERLADRTVTVWEENGEFIALTEHRSGASARMGGCLSLNSAIAWGASVAFQRCGTLVTINP